MIKWNCVCKFNITRSSIVLSDNFVLVSHFLSLLLIQFANDYKTNLMDGRTENVCLESEIGENRESE